MSSRARIFAAMAFLWTFLGAFGAGMAFDDILLWRNGTSMAHIIHEGCR